MRKYGGEGNPINVGLIGLGTVGGGVAKYLQREGDRHNIHLAGVAVARPTLERRRSFPGLTTEARDIINDPNIHIVVELMGGQDPAFSYIREAIGRKKSVVTANKAVVASHARELFDAATTAGVDMGYEGSVAGGIPILNTLSRYRGQRIESVRGVLNGTTNFILTQMEQGLTFDGALKIAQERGFAEANHILDTGGYDTRDKLAILASVVFNAEVNPASIEPQGITDITPVDLDFARKYGVDEGGPGYAVKLLAVANRQNGAVALRVNPALIRRDQPLAAVMDEVNGISLDGGLMGPQTFTGRGAGRDATTSAVVSDIVRIADNMRSGIQDPLPTLDEEVVFVAPDATEQRGYIRVDLLDRAGSIHDVSGILAGHGLNIHDSVQRGRFARQTENGLVIPDIITVDAVSRRVMQEALRELSESDRVYGQPVFMSIED